MRPGSPRALALVAASFVVVGAARADTVRLDNGSVLNGTVILETAAEVTLQRGEAFITIPRKRVRKIERAVTEPPAVLVPIENTPIVIHGAPVAPAPTIASIPSASAAVAIPAPLEPIAPRLVGAPAVVSPPVPVTTVVAAAPVVGPAAPIVAALAATARPAPEPLPRLEPTRERVVREIAHRLAAGEKVEDTLGDDETLVLLDEVTRDPLLRTRPLRLTSVLKPSLDGTATKLVLALALDRDASPTLRMQALVAGARTKRIEAVPALVSLYNDRDMSDEALRATVGIFKREASARASFAGKPGFDDAVRALRRAAASTNPSIEVRAGRALAEAVSAADSRELVELARADDSESVRRAVLAGLIRRPVDPRDANVVKAALGWIASGPTDVRALAAQLAVRTKDRTAVPALIELLEVTGQERVALDALRSITGEHALRTRAEWAAWWKTRS